MTWQDAQREANRWPGRCWGKWPRGHHVWNRFQFHCPVLHNGRVCISKFGVQIRNATKEVVKSILLILVITNCQAFCHCEESPIWIPQHGALQCWVFWPQSWLCLCFAVKLQVEPTAGKVPKGTTEVSVVQRAYRALMRRSLVVSGWLWKEMISCAWCENLKLVPGNCILTVQGNLRMLWKQLRKSERREAVCAHHFTCTLLYMIVASCQCQAKEACERGLSRQEPCGAQATSMLSLWSLELAGKKKACSNSDTNWKLFSHVFISILYYVILYYIILYYVTLYSICHVTLSTWGQSNLVSCAPPSWLIGRCKKIHPFVAFPSVQAIPNSEPQSYDAWTCFKGQLSNLWIRYHSEVYWAVDLCRLCRLTRSWCQAALCCSPGQRKFQLSGRLFFDRCNWHEQMILSARMWESQQVYASL